MMGHCDEGEFRAHNDWISVYFITLWCFQDNALLN